MRPTDIGIAPGKIFSRQHRFDPEQVITFATAAGDENPLHHDAEFAGQSRYGRLIVSGTHTTALLLGLTASHFASKARSVVGVRFAVEFQRAVAADETVTLSWTIEDIRPHAKAGSWYVDLKGDAADSDSKICVLATGTILIRLAVDSADSA